MKKTKLLISIFAIFCVVTTKAQQRTSLVELFSGASCSPCAIHVPELEDTLSHFQDKVIVLRHQLEIPAYDPMYLDYPAGPDNRYAYYSLYGVPALMMDGTVDEFDLTKHIIDSMTSIPSPFNINLTYTKTSSKIDVNMIVTAVSNVTGNLKARIAVIENEIAFPTPPGSNGERFFFKVLKQFIPSPTGTALASSWTAGEDDTITGSWTFVNVYNKDEIAVIAYIQNDDTKEILQAAFAKPVVLNDFDAAITTVSDVPSKICSGVVPELSPRLTLVNKGNIPLTTVDIEYGVNDSVEGTYTWNRNLNSYEYNIIKLPGFIPDTLMENIFFVSIKSVNDSVPDDNADNDTLDQRYGVSMKLDNQFIIKFKTGNLGANFGWRIVNDAGTVTQYYNYNTNVNDSVFTITNLNPDCWYFILKNINNVLSPQNFYFRVYNMDGTMMYETKTIGHTLNIPFYNILNVGVEENSQQAPELIIYPNPANDAVTFDLKGIPSTASISFYNALGAKVIERNLNSSSIIPVSGLKEGVYFYHVVDKGKVLSQGKMNIMR
jgi:hypothetical protein